MSVEIPWAQGEEKSVLSSIFKKPEILDECAHLTPEHFHLPANRIIFEKATEIVAKGMELELVSFVRIVHEAGLLDIVGGPAHITDIFTYAPNAAHFKSHLGTLTEKLSLRRAIKLATDIQEAIAENKEPGEVAEMVANRSTLLSDTLEETKPPSDTPALLRAAARRWEALALGQEEAMGITTSLSDLNQLFRGLKPRRVTVISALPSQGKTLLGGQLFMDAVSDGHKGLFLTWEMSEDELIDRFLAYAARKPINAVTDPLRYSKEIWGNDKPSRLDRDAMVNSFRKVSAMPLRVQAMHGQSITQAIAAIRREHRKGPLAIVVLDFIQRIGPAKHLDRQPFERQLADIADRFQNLAQELGFHGIVLSQLNKDGAAKHAEAINESCALHLKIVKIAETGKDGTPVMVNGSVKIKAEGIGVVKDRFHGQKDKLLPIKLNPQNQRFESHHNN